MSINFQKAYSPFLDKENKIHNTIKFGASGSNNYENFLHHTEEQAEQAIEGYLFGKVFEAGKANSSDYRKLDKYRNLPPQIAQGEEYLKMATSAENPKPACELAEREFVDAARSSVNTHKARGLRMAAIAAKLRGESEKARTYMDYSKSLTWDKNLEQDKRNMDEECNFLVNRVAEPVKRLALAPVRLVEGMARGVVGDLLGDRLEDEPYYFTTQLTSPFQVALKKTEAELTAHRRRLLDGEASDDEWVDGKDRVKLGTSTGKGLRHPYRSIEIAEEKRIEAQRKATETRRAEAAEQAKKLEQQRKAEEEAQLAAKQAEMQRKASEEARQAECCKKTSYGIVAVIAMLWGLASLGKQNG